MLVMHTCAHSNNLYIRLPYATAVLVKITKAADVCSTVENEKESYNKLPQVKGLVPVAHTCACSNTLQIWLHKATSYVCQVSKAAGVCSTVRNAKESYNELHQVKALVPIPHACSPHSQLNRHM
jgi:hypothetical protein